MELFSKTKMTELCLKNIFAITLKKEAGVDMIYLKLYPYPMDRPLLVHKCKYLRGPPLQHQGDQFRINNMHLYIRYQKPTCKSIFGFHHFPMDVLEFSLIKIVIRKCCFIKCKF